MQVNSPESSMPDWARRTLETSLNQASIPEQSVHFIGRQLSHMITENPDQHLVQMITKKLWHMLDEFSANKRDSA